MDKSRRQGEKDKGEGGQREEGEEAQGQGREKRDRVREGEAYVPCLSRDLNPLPVMASHPASSSTSRREQPCARAFKPMSSTRLHPPRFSS